MAERRLSRTTFGTVLLAPLASVVVAGSFSACESTTELEPNEQTSAAPQAEDATRDRVKGVLVLTQADPWPGEMPIEEVVTPVLVRIDNDGRIPIDVRYRDLSLLGPDGKRYGAVPPYRIESDIGRPAIDMQHEPVTDPGFTGSGFELAPYYSAAYPGMAVYEDVFVFDRNYYDTAYRYWQETELPTYEMLQQALPEGVVLSGGNVEGWVYFEKVPVSSGRVVLHTELVDSRNGRQFARIRVPYEVN